MILFPPCAVIKQIVDNNLEYRLTNKGCAYRLFCNTISQNAFPVPPSASL